MTPWTAACQAPLFIGFSSQEHWSGLPFPFPRDLPNPRIEPRSPTLQADSLPTELQDSTFLIEYYFFFFERSTHKYMGYFNLQTWHFLKNEHLTNIYSRFIILGCFKSLLSSGSNKIIKNFVIHI